MSDKHNSPRELIRNFEHEKIDVVVQLEPWDQKKVYDRMGVDSQTTDILGLKVPLLTIFL